MPDFTVMHKAHCQSPSKTLKSRVFASHQVMYYMHLSLVYASIPACLHFTIHPIIHIGHIDEIKEMVSILLLRQTFTFEHRTWSVSPSISWRSVSCCDRYLQGLVVARSLSVGALWNATVLWITAFGWCVPVLSDCRIFSKFKAIKSLSYTGKFWFGRGITFIFSWDPR